MPNRSLTGTAKSSYGVDVPSPVGHLLGGAIAGLALQPGGLLLCALAGAAPDIDFLWGRHGAETHSVGAALLAGVVVLAWTRGRQPRLAVAVMVAWSTHVLFDWLGSDDTPPLGVMALWPLADTYYFAHAYVFDAISRRYWLPGFVTQNVLAVVKEVLMLGPITLALAWLRRAKVEGKK